MKALCASSKQPALPPGTTMKALPAPKHKSLKQVSLIHVSHSVPHFNFHVCEQSQNLSSFKIIKIHPPRDRQTEPNTSTHTHTHTHTYTHTRADANIQQNSNLNIYYYQRQTDTKDQEDAPKALTWRPSSAKRSEEKLGKLSDKLFISYVI